MMIASLAFAYSGFAILCATTRRHSVNSYLMKCLFHKSRIHQNHNAKNSQTVFAAWPVKSAILLLRLAGLILISMALMYCMAIWGITVGTAAGWLVLAMAAYLVVLTATYLPKKLTQGALIGLLIAVVATGITLS